LLSDREYCCCICLQSSAEITLQYCCCISLRCSAEITIPSPFWLYAIRRSALITHSCRNNLRHSAIQILQLLLKYPLTQTLVAYLYICTMHMFCYRPDAQIPMHVFMLQTQRATIRTQHLGRRKLWAQKNKRIWKYSTQKNGWVLKQKFNQISSCAPFILHTYPFRVEVFLWKCTQIRPRQLNCTMHATSALTMHVAKFSCLAVFFWSSLELRIEVGCSSVDSILVKLT